MSVDALRAQWRMTEGLEFGDALVASAGAPVNPLDRLEGVYLEAFEAVVERALAEARQRVIDRVRDRARALAPTEVVSLVADGADPFAVDDVSVFSASEWAEMFDVDAVDVIGDVVVDASDGSALVIGTNVTDDEVAAVIDRHVRRLKDLGPAVQASVSESLEMAVRNKMSLDEAVADLTTRGALSPGAAQRLARTELAAAANGGMHAAWVGAGVPFKRWRALHDGRTRHAHMEADGQTVPVGMAFEVGGRMADYPGDPKLPAALRSNCRCYMERIDADGRVSEGDFDTATKDELSRLATQLGIPGRSKMNKAQLREAIDQWRSGFGQQRMDQMTRNQLLQRARLAGIKNRHKMTKAQLQQALRAGQVVPGAKGEDRFRADSGYVTREELAADQKRARADQTTMERLGAEPETLAPITAEQAEALRAETFRRYKGQERGHIGCTCCGAKLHAGDGDGEAMSLVKLNPERGWEPKNVIPVCRADAERVARTGKTGFEPSEPVAAPSRLKARDFVTSYRNDPRIVAGVDASDEERALLKVFDDTIDEAHNATLRAGGGKATAETKVVDALLDRSEVPFNVVVHRGMKLPYDSEMYRLLAEQGVRPGSVITDPGYVSTTVSKDSAARYLGIRGVSGRDEYPVLLEIRVPQGTKGIFTDPLTGKGDGQLLLPKGTKLRVVSTPVHEMEGTRIIVEVVPDRAVHAGAEIPAPRPRGRDVLYPTWGDRGAELSVADPDERPLRDLISDRVVPAAYNSRLRNGLETHVTAADFDRRRGTIRVDADVRDGTGVRVGRVSHTTTTEAVPTGDGDVEYLTVARIDRLEVVEGKRGVGVSTDVVRELENYWVSQGVGEVHIGAEGAGGFSFARRGYDWDLDGDGMDNIGQRVADRLTQATPKALRPFLTRLAKGQPVDLRSPEVRKALQAAGWTGPQLAEVAEMQQRLRTRSRFDSAFPFPAEVAAVGQRSGATTWAGKDAMTGLKWSAVKWLSGPEAVVAAAGDWRAERRGSARAVLLARVAQAYDEWVSRNLAAAPFDDAAATGDYGLYYLDTDSGPAAQADYLRALREALTVHALVSSGWMHLAGKKPSLVPPKGAQQEAARGLQWVKEGHGGDGLQDATVGRARTMAKGQRRSPETVRRMRDYFNRHQSDKQGKGFHPGEEGYPSPGRVAWALWGGDVGWRWAIRTAKALDQAEAGEGSLKGWQRTEFRWKGNNNRWKNHKRPIASPEARHFANDAEAMAFARDTFAGEFSGLTTKVTAAELLGEDDHRKLLVTGTIHDQSGNRVGKFEREFWPDGSPDWGGDTIPPGTVRHVTLKLDKEHQGQGFAQRFNDHAEESYAANGFHQVEVEAGMSVGGYAWARQGYRLRDDGWSADSLNSRVDEFIGKGSLDSDQAGVLRGLIGQGDMPAIAALSYGKDFLLGSAWSGVRPVRQAALTAAASTISGRLAEWAATWEPQLLEYFDDGNDDPDYDECWSILAADEVPEARQALDVALSGAARLTVAGWAFRWKGNDNRWHNHRGMRPATDEDRARLKIPPAWTEVHVSEDPAGVSGLIARGVDAKGRTQRVYSAEHTEAQAAKKFKRVQQLSKKLDALDGQLAEDAAGDDTAAALMLIRRTGMRPGSTANTKAATQAYGASTLEARHVTLGDDGRSVRFQFTGKKGVDIDLTVDDPELHGVLAPRLSGKKGSDKVFDTSDERLRSYMSAAVPGGYKVKDLRTVRANTVALQAIKAMPKPTTKREFQSARLEVARTVAAQLGNTPTVALASYINPTVFGSWLEGIG